MRLVLFYDFLFFLSADFFKNTTNGRAYFFIVRFVRVGRAGHCIFQP